MTPLVAIPFDQLNGWEEDSHLEAFRAFLKTALRAVEKPYTTHSLGISSEALQYISRNALEATIGTDEAARQFFEDHFTPHLIEAEGHLTGYYEPIVEASAQKTDQFNFPILARPDDLIDITDTNRGPDLPQHIRFGLQTSDGSVAMYHDRAAIEGTPDHKGVLTGKGLEIAWVADPMDAYFIHIQGSARLSMTDGSEKRVTYAAKSGHDYQSIGKILLESGHLSADDVTMTSLRRWFRENPERRTEITWQNPSYIFFEEVQIKHPGDGPIAAAKVALSGGRSLAVDRLIHTYGCPIWIELDSPAQGLEGPDCRLMVAQDTGSAIVGAARGDVYVGSGPEAGEVAGAINHKAVFAVLVPNASAPK
jgi:membrane-bound lytic murein transglycosylase A